MKILRTIWQRLSERVAGSAATAEKQAKDEAGFTLIELVVVLAIIGALTALIVPRVLSAMNQAYVSTATNTAREIQTSMSVFESGNNGSLPGDWNDTNGSGATNNPGWNVAGYTYLYGDIGQSIALPADSTQADFDLNAVTDSNVLSGVGVSEPSGTNYYADGTNYVLIVTAKDRDGTLIVITNPGGTYATEGGTHFGKAGIYTYDPKTMVFSQIN